MPIDYSQYPSNWKTEIRPAVLKRAGGSDEDPRINAFCEECGKCNWSIVFYEPEDDSVNYHWFDGIYDVPGWHVDFPESYSSSRALCDEINNSGSYESKRSVVVLTISHTDHDITNNDMSNLKALCQRCHLRHDAPYHAMNRRINKAKKVGQLMMFEGGS